MEYKEEYQGIYLDFSKHAGLFRIVESGLGWKPSAGSGGSFTLDKLEITQAQWSRAARGYELKIFTRNQGIIQLDGFKEDDLNRLTRNFKHCFNVTVENKEHSLRGWNWGKTEFGREELHFNVQSRPAFEIPYSEISNTNLAGKNEVAVELSLPADTEANGVNGALGGARPRGQKAGGARDQLMEMRFYIPGTASKKEKREDGEDISDGDNEEEMGAAQLFYDTLMNKAQIGDVAGDTVATFLEILHLTPRGRFDIDFYETSLRLRGKTYDYKIQYESIKRAMALPKPDEMHMLLTFGLDPPLRQGQTRYPFVVMQFKRDEEINLDLNLTDEQLESKFKGRLTSHYEAPISTVITQLFRGLTGKKVVAPSKEFSSHHSQCGVKCSIKANEGHLFMMDKSFMFVPKPATYVSFDNIALITLSRVGGQLAASRTFDMTIKLKGNSSEHQFSNINREEQQPLEDFFRAKNLKTKNEMEEDSSALLKAALADDDLASSDEDVVAANRGSADEDSEEADEDFQEDSESDVAEEFDSAHESEGDSDEEMADADDAEPDADMEEERPKKKAKTKK